MLSFLRRIGLAAALGVITHSLSAQDDPIKFGKIEATAFEASQYKGSKEASAIVLCDFGTSRIVGAQDGFKVVFDRVTRVLVLNKAGYEQATVAVPLYHHEGNKEELLNLRGFTYNLAGDKIEKLKLDGKATFEEKLDERRSLRKFTMPAVREGSIIEYAYTIKSDFLFNLQDWQFQRDVPVAWSEYRTIIPGYFQYKEIPHGHLPYAAQGRDIVGYSTGYTQSTSDHYGVHSAATGSGHQLLLSGKAVRSVWVMKNVPAFREEPFMTTRNDYLAAIDFELDKVVFDPQRPQQVSSTWEKIATDLLQDEKFGVRLQGRSPLHSAAEALKTQHADPGARAAAAVALVQGKVRYNSQERLYATNALRRVADLGQGSAAEINLLLVQTLRDAGLEAQPVLLSTRRNGTIQTEVPVLSQFNYVVAAVAIPGQPELLLDATEPLVAPGTLPARCLGGQGRLITPGGGKWVSLAPKQRHLRLTSARLTLDAQGGLQGSLREEYNGYAGLAERNEVAAQGEPAYLKALAQQHPDWKLTDAKLLNLDKPDQSLLLETNLAVATPANGAGQQLYLPVMQLVTNLKNPFEHAERTYPVDFGTQHEAIATVQLVLPASLAVEELPKPLQLELPNGAGRYIYEVKQMDNTLHLTSRLQLRKTQYLPHEYAALRELFTRSVAKHAEPLVLRRAQ
ncbi:DUF3858 domain-containing protein [Hymenobacter latericus]|uniref:DUF3858 domain-containing protein n=1 Tax=Hymenobacter sp. YIM 151858-1 TaxID=2987688 RepID=UPI002226081C|nr:DUF3858 domain-containing protein [Hymenobacter sp. YIM 151858-1]UYZ57485.1 DUF3858 domain-containing protein [Hymenobacter sp. YIM 151858-1]